VRTDHWKLIHYVDLDGMDELYDLRDDPFEMKNLFAAPAAQGAHEHLRSELARLLAN
jgi:arylsulfatase A-like enzyme